MNTDIIYLTGYTENMDKMIGGLWRLHRQEGFPIDTSLIEVRERGWFPDWMDLLAEATVHGELPTLEKQVEIPDVVKPRFMAYLKHHGYPEVDFEIAAKRLLEKKRSDGVKVS